MILLLWLAPPEDPSQEKADERNLYAAADDLFMTVKSDGNCGAIIKCNTA